MERKDILTKERIAEDLKSESSPWSLIPLALLTLATGALLFWSISVIVSYGEFEIADMLVIILTAAYFVFSVGIVVYVVARIVSWKQIATRFDFHVIEDTLVAAEDSLDSMDSHDLNRHGYSYYLYFDGFGKYHLMNTTYYRWSQSYAMGIRGMMTYATPGDTYYIVTRDHKTILYVYNTKLFEYKET